VYDTYLRMPFGRSGTWVEMFEQFPRQTTGHTWVPIPPGTSPSVEMQFRDASGRRWRRDWRGDLDEITDDTDWSAFTQTDLGAYESYAAHPTMNIHLDEDGNRLPY
jgi:hypothetical protein